MRKILLTGALLLGACSGIPGILGDDNDNETRKPTPPAELPPANYFLDEYTDSRGCNYIRAAGNNRWAPRVNVSGSHICGGLVGDAYQVGQGVDDIFGTLQTPASQVAPDPDDVQVRSETGIIGGLRITEMFNRVTGQDATQGVEITGPIERVDGSGEVLNLTQQSAPSAPATRVVEEVVTPAPIVVEAPAPVVQTPTPAPTPAPTPVVVEPVVVEVPAPQPQPAPAPVAAGPSGDVLVGTFNDAGNAKRLAEGLQARGYQVTLRAQDGQTAVVASTKAGQSVNALQAELASAGFKRTRVIK